MVAVTTLCQVRHASMAYIGSHFAYTLLNAKNAALSITG